MIALMSALLLAQTFPQLAAQAEAAREKGQPAIPLYQRALKLNPAWMEGWWGLGTIHYTRKEYAECAADFEQFTRLEPSAGTGHAMAGLCLFPLKRYDEALSRLQLARKFGVPSDAIATPAMFTLAELQTKRGDFEAAMSILAEFAQLDKQGPAFIQLSGIAALWKPLFPDELPVADRELVFLAGAAFWEMGRRNIPAAREKFEDLAARYPSVPGVHYLYGSFEMMERPDRSIQLFEQELAVNPNHIGALVALGSEHLRRGDAVKAKPYALKSVDLAPKSYAPHTLLGRIYTETAELQPAVKELELARSLEPEDPQPHIALASVYAKLGRKEDAARERREFLRIQSNNKKPLEK
jgi:tetratricopeptide (TPR) repeat protein